MKYDWKQEYDSLASDFLKLHFGNCQQVGWAKSFLCPALN